MGSKENFNCTQILKGHTDSVRCLLKPEDRKMVSGSSDKPIKTLDPKENFNYPQTLKGHTNNVNCLLKLDYRKIASRSEDKTIMV